MLRIFKKMDIISKKPKLFIEEKRRFQTEFGGILSLIAVCLITSAFGVFFIEFIKREKPIITFNQVYNNSQFLNYTNLPIMFMIQDVNFKPLVNPEKFWTVQVETWDVKPITNENGETEITTTKLKQPFELCDINKHFTGYEEMFKGIPYLNLHYCIPLGVNITLFGSYGGLGEYSYLNIFLKKCANDTKIICSSTDTILSTLNNVRLSVKFPDYSINHDNLTQPFQNIIHADTIQVTSTTFKRFWYYARIISYITDLGYVFTESKHEQFYQFNDYIETLDLRTNPTVANSFCQISLLTDKKSDRYNRSFLKAQSVIANTGGLIKAILLFAFLCNEFFCSEMFVLHLVKQVYEPFKATPIQIIPKEKKSSKFFSGLGLASPFPQSFQNTPKKDEDPKLKHKTENIKTIQITPKTRKSSPKVIMSKEKHSERVKFEGGTVFNKNIHNMSKQFEETSHQQILKNVIDNIRTPISRGLSYPVQLDFLKKIPRGFMKIFSKRNNNKAFAEYKFIKTKIMKFLDVIVLLKSLHNFENNGICSQNVNI
jgi:hypothetical protein